MAPTKLHESTTALLRAYLDSVALSEGVQTRVWHTAQLTLTQVRALRRLEDVPKSLGQLGEELALSPTSITHLADRLEKRGLIERGRDDEDRRKVMAVLTDEGRTIINVVPVLTGTAIRAAVELMNIAERVRIAAALRDFNVAVKQIEQAWSLAEAEH